jgi:hypothetical protein
MKLNNIKKLLPIAIAVLGLTGCLKGDSINIPSSSDHLFQLEYIDLANNGTTINSGLNYFGKGALTFPSTDASDTVKFIVDLVGTGTLNKDVTITVGPDNNALLDNFSSDSISYEAMPDSTYSLVSATGTIKAGTRTAAFSVVVYPGKFDPTRSYMLPLTVTDPQGYAVSQNYGHLYLHVIGNPIAGAYTWDFTRFNNSDGSGTPNGASFTGESTVFKPVNPTSIKVATGYYTQPSYVISFKNNGGSLSNFSAKFDAGELKSNFTDNGITITQDPIITVSADNKTFTVQYVAFNGSAFRYIIDKYYK